MNNPIFIFSLVVMVLVNNIIKCYLALSANKGGISVAAFQTGNTSSGGFKIFCDDYPDAASSLPPSTGEWQMPPTEPVIKKENTQKPGKWTDAKVQ